MDERLLNKLDEYAATFKEGFPMMVLGHRDPEEVIKIIDDCIAKKKNVYDSGYLSLDEDAIY